MVTERKRPYLSDRRQRQAAETRRRLADSARRLFRERGYAATTIADIAAGADLAVQTFYAVYGSKRGVLSGLIDRMEEDADLPEFLDSFRTAADPRAQLALIVDFNLRLYARGADIIETLRSAAAADPQLAEVHREGDSRRRAAQARLVRSWARSASSPLRVPERQAADILWAMTSPELYQLFVEQNGWSPDRFGEWLLRLLSSLLLGD